MRRLFSQVEKFSLKESRQAEVKKSFFSALYGAGLLDNVDVSRTHGESYRNRRTES